MKCNFQLVSIAIVTSLTLTLGGCVTAKQKKLDLGIKPINNQELKTLFSKPLDVKYFSNTRNNIISLSSVRLESCMSFF